MDNKFEKLGITYTGLAGKVNIETERRKVVESIVRAIRDNPDRIINWTVNESGDEISVSGHIVFINPGTDIG